MQREPGRLDHATGVLIRKGRQRLQGEGLASFLEAERDAIGDGMGPQRVHRRVVLTFGDMEVAVVEVAHQPAVTFQMPVDPLPDVRYQNLQCDACKPRCLQLKATSLSSWQSSQRIP